ncbi:Short neuropeptide F [Chionoecetes opilio]|uniref:Short neuropeptide F n=1 Tax=Chionoecetes opilio TaxID=41210 RepID=A0A8J5C154_CHIOP|nr:Short neuropeptide F [Chionoecetes opilio]
MPLGRKPHNKVVYIIGLSGAVSPLQQEAAGRGGNGSGYREVVLMESRPLLEIVMGVSGVKCWVAVVCCCLMLCHLTTAAPADYDSLNDMYDWLAEHGMDRRGPPSMRLRFGKRDMGWQVAQRSMPSLRLRFGKRNVDQIDPILDHDIIRKDVRAPALRLRFGKRDATFGEIVASVVQWLACLATNLRALVRSRARASR